MKRPKQPFNAAALFFTLLGLTHALTIPAPAAHLSTAGSVHSQSTHQGPPDPPSAPPPAGNRQPGGSLGDESASCPTPARQLTALTPADGLGHTLAEEPTFWFYVPYPSEDIQKGEFSILTQNETERVYKTTFTLPETPGFVSIQVPSADAVQLSEGQYYRWYLNLYCTSTSQSDLGPDVKIDGWVQPLARTPEREQQVSRFSPDIWYDTISELAEQLQTGSPGAISAEEAVSLRAQWANLLNAVGLANFVDEPVVGPVLTVETATASGSEE